LHMCEARSGWGALYIPGTAVLTNLGTSAVVACRFPTASPCHPGPASQPGKSESRDIIKSFRIVALPNLPFACDRHGWDSSP
jgi:hypothetical protein